MGQGYAPSEGLCYDEGRLTTPSFSEYHILTAMNVSFYQSIIVESRSGLGPFAAKGIGKPSLTPVTPAIGARMFDLPDVPERVVRAPGDGDGAR